MRDEHAAFLVRTRPFIPIPPDYLTDDGLRVVDWRICGVDTNVEQLAEIARYLDGTN